MKMHSLKESARGMAVVTAAVALMTAIFAIPVPSAAAASAVAPTAAHQYTQYGVITAAEDDVSGTVYEITDDNGDMWEFSAETDAFTVGENVSMTMDDAGTPAVVEDDSILSVTPINLDFNPYEYIRVGSLGRYILGGTIAGQYETEFGSCTWIIDQYDQDLFFYGQTGAAVGQHITLVMDANGTPSDFSDDFILDILYSDCQDD